VAHHSMQLAECSAFVLMEVETLGVARSLGWKVHMRCANGYRQEARSMRKCVYRSQLKGASEAKHDAHRACGSLFLLSSAEAL
jgi:hypothetical protein